MQDHGNHDDPGVNFVKKKLRYHTTKKNVQKNLPHGAYGNIDAMYEKKLTEFDKIQSGKTKFEKKLKKAQKDMLALNAKKVLTDDDMELRANLKDIIDECTTKIEEANTHDVEAEFFFQNDAYELIADHYDKTTDGDDISETMNTDESGSFTCMKEFMDHIKHNDNNTTQSKKFNEFMFRTMDREIIKKKKYDKCSHCGKKNTMNMTDGRMVCTYCGYCDIDSNDMEKTNFKDSLYENKSTSYQRINHFSELLIHLQGKESTDIKPEIYKNIKREIKKQGITNPYDLTHDRLRGILKKLDYNNYFEHRSYIIYQITGIKPPTFQHETEVKLKKMFKDIQIPYEKHKPVTRKNFLNYDFVFGKFFELLGMDEYIKYLTELKSAEKKKEHDIIWEKICAELRWEYIPSQ